MCLSKWGFSTSIKNVEYLDKIFDIIGNQIKIQEINWKKYAVWDESMITFEIEEYQKKLSKKWYTYTSYTNFKGCEFILIKDFNQIMLKEKQKQEMIKKRKIKEERKENANRGIYGIYCNEKLIYIGKTNVSFTERFQQHKQALEKQNKDQYLYKFLLEEQNQKSCNIVFKPLIDIKDLKLKGKITNRDIESMELALIYLYQPICNIQGRIQPYEYS